MVSGGSGEDKGGFSGFEDAIDPIEPSTHRQQGNIVTAGGDGGIGIESSPPSLGDPLDSTDVVGGVNLMDSVEEGTAGNGGGHNPLKAIAPGGIFQSLNNGTQSFRTLGMKCASFVFEKFLGVNNL